jgi:hypothetical protein
MLRSTALFFLLFVTTAKAQNQNGEVLNNYSILNMVKNGLSAPIVSAKIKTNQCNFDTSTDALIFLKNSKVSDDIITLMVEKSTNGSNQSGYITSTPVNYDRSEAKNKPVLAKYSREVETVLPHLFESGIYYLNPEDSSFTKVDATVVTSNKAGGFGQLLATSATLGLASMKSKSSLDGEVANLHINEGSPIFYFYFDFMRSTLNSSSNKENVATDNNYFSMLAKSMSNAMNQDNSTAMSPNDFKLIHLDGGKNSRSFVSQKSNAYNVTSGVDSKYIIGMKYERLTPSLFRVTFEDGLKNGQYCFSYAGNSNKQSSMYSFYQVNDVKVFDFGVKAESKKKKR